MVHGLQWDRAPHALSVVQSFEVYMTGNVYHTLILVVRRTRSTGYSGL